MTRSKINESHTVRAGRVTITQKSEPIEINTDNAGDPIAEAIAKAISAGIKAVSTSSKDGKHRLLNDTGKLANGITVEKSGDTYAIVPPPDRLNPADFRSPEAYQRVIDQLHQNVPATEEPLEDPVVNAAIMAALDAIVK